MGKTQLLPSPLSSPPKATVEHSLEKQVPSSSFDKVTHWHPDAHFLDQRAVPLNQGDFGENKVGSVCLWLQKGRLRLHAWTVWGSLYSSAMSPHGGGLIGGPKEPPVLCSSLTKHWGAVAYRMGVKQLALVMSRFPIEWLAGINSNLGGGLAFRLQWNMTHSFSHPLTHSQACPYTHI